MRNIQWALLSLIAITISIGIGLVGCSVAGYDRLSGVALTPIPETAMPHVPFPPSQVSDPEQLVHNWLMGVPCRPPCWEDITPGRTAFTQSLAILNRLPFVTDIERYDAVVKPSLTGSEKGEIYWNWKGEEAGGKVSYSISSTVYGVTVGYPSGLLALQDVIDAYGEPSHVLAEAGPSTDGNYTVYALDIVYLSQGFALALRGQNTYKPNLSPDWSDFYLFFFEPTSEGFAVAWGNPQAAARLVPWRGMLSFEDYCVGTRCK